MVGRTREKKRLLDALESDYSEFVAVYGRRRVGKTFLIRETFGYSFTFQHTGVANGTLAEQLAQFRSALRECGYEDCPPLCSWFDAFDAIKGEAIDQLDKYSADTALTAKWRLKAVEGPTAQLFNFSTSQPFNLSTDGAEGSVSLHRLVLVFKGGDSILCEGV